MPAVNCVPVPDGVPIEVAALAEPLSIAANVLTRTGISPDDTVLIYGAGTVGITVLQVAKLHGARCIVADLDEARLERAVEFGADLTVHSGRDSVPNRVASERGSARASSSTAPAFRRCWRRPAASPARPAASDFSASRRRLATSASRRSSRRNSCWWARGFNRRLLPDVVDWIASGRLAPAGMITQTYPARDARAAFDLIEQHPEQTIKVHLDFS